jgi:hypothetical protein
MREDKKCIKHIVEYLFGTSAMGTLAGKYC